MSGFLKKIAFVSLLFFCMFSCRETSPNNTSTKKTSEIKVPPVTQPSQSVEKKKECEIKGKILEGNRKIVEGKNTLVVIVADEKNSHRKLEIYNTSTCELIKSEVLPINISADFPYMVADIIYNKNSHLVAIKGHGAVYCYDVENQKLMDALIPDYLNERIAADASSGKIKHLEVWENYLIGYAEDIGAFVFDLTDTAHPKNLLPAAEFDLSEGEGEDFASLFFLKSQNGKNTYQAIAPNYDYDNFKFQVNPLFKTPKNVSISIPPKEQNDRFVLLKMKDKNVFVVNMETQKNVALPDQLKNKTSKEILNWLKKQS
ncbi:MAG: hypothetical protein AB8F94_25755 [Saprospiraceae bacterium]